MSVNSSIPILHIGYAKTATTWFQNSFYSTVKGIKFFDMNTIRRTLKKSWSELELESNVTPILYEENKRLVICDESMIGFGEGMQSNAYKYKHYFNSAQIVIFIRNQIDKFPSHYSQYIKSGGTESFSDFISTKKKRKHMIEKHYYDEIITLYRNVFGKQNVYVYLYEELMSDPKSFIEEFCLIHSLDIPGQKISFKKQNIALSLSLLSIKRISNRITRQNKYSQRISNRIKKWLKLSSDFHFSNLIFEVLNELLPFRRKMDIEKLIGKEETKQLGDLFRESNQRLIDKHGICRIRDFNYPL